MSKLIVRTAMFGILLVSLAAFPAMAQIIPAGPDYWVTPANGRTTFTFPDGDVESLCGAAISSFWNHKVLLTGIPVAGADYDTVVRRLDNAVFTSTTSTASTRIQVARLAFRSLVAQDTPCGVLDWTVGLSGPQRVTNMLIRRTSDRGGIFNAEIAVDVEFRAHDADGSYVGSLFYAFNLPDPSTGTGAGTPWSFGLNGQFRPGMTETENCIDVLREKLTQYAIDSDHYYYISDLISQGKCGDRPN